MVFMIILGFVTWQQTDRLAQQTEEIYNHPLKVRRALGDLNTEIQSIHKGMKSLMLSESEAETEQILQEMENDKAVAFKQFDIVYERFLGDKKLVDEAYNQFVKWNTIRDETIRIFRSGDKQTALERTKPNGVGGSQAVVVMECVSRIDELSIKFGDKFYQDSLKNKVQLRQQMVFVFAIVLALTFLIVYVLTRGINRPLEDLTYVTKQFSEGNRFVRSKYVSKNEFGMLAKGFNEMANVIESELELSTKSASLSAIMLKEEDPKKFCYEILKNLLELTESNLGAVYLLNNDTNAFEIFAAIGVDADKCKIFDPQSYEGEFGLAIASGQMQHIKSIPADSCFVFSTVVGTFVPREIVTIPILTKDEVVAIISITSVKSYSSESLKLFKSIISVLSARMNGILTYRKLIDVYGDLKVQNTELESQKSELQEMAYELSEQNTELEMQKRQLDEVNRLKSSFLSNMSHELRTPLNSVIALSGVLNRRLSGKVPDEEYSYLEVIERNGKHLLELINDILDLSRIESGKEDIDLVNFNMDDLIGEIAVMIEPQVQQKKISLKINPNTEPIIVCSDYNKCRHIIQNIIANAVKFTEKGEVSVFTEKSGDNIVVKIIDSGIGIENDQIKFIFDEFRQVDASNARKYGGSGLGLSIARKYSDMIGGKILVESIKGEGSEFRFVLPLICSNNNNNQNVEDNIYSVAKTQIADNQNGSGKRILIVEDTDAMVVQLKYILEMEDYTVDVAEDGMQALNYLVNNSPQAIILDLMMPEVDGFETLHKIRNQKRYADLPILILTAKFLSKEELSALRSNNIHQLIRKGDVSKDQLLKSVASMMTKCKEVEEIVSDVKIPEKQVENPVVLAIDDNADNMLALRALIADHCTLIEASNAAAGIGLAKLHIPNLILLDIAMPDMNGSDALAEIRKCDNLKHIPVIAVTSSAMKGSKELFISHGFDGYVSKPIEIQLLNAEMDKWLGKV
jgi:signal transduction histidine kinase/DNA-binding response OmpR family regulator/HAMP domain-containing protein